MQLADALDIAADEARRLGSQSWDIFGARGRSKGLVFFQGKVQNTELSSSQGVGVRLFREGRPGYSSCERFYEPSIRQCVRDAWALALLTDPVDVALPSLVPPLSEPFQTWNPELEGVDLDVLAPLAAQLEETCLAFDPKISNVPHAGIEVEEHHSALVNSSGFSYASRSNSCGLGVAAVATLDGTSKMGSFSSSGRSFTALDAGAVARVAAERSLELLGAAPVETGTYPVLFSRRVSPMLLALYAQMFMADSVQKGLSRLQGRLGQRIAVDGFDLLSDPHRSDLPGSRLYDMEGMPSRRVELVKDGILTDLLYNLESAAKDGRESNACAQRSWQGKVGAGFSNLIVPPGHWTLDELLGGAQRMLYIVKLEGSTGCSSVSGELSIGAQGFLVESGRIVRPVDRVTLSGNIFDLLMNIEALGSSYEPTWSSYKVPDLLVRSLTVAG